MPDVNKLFLEFVKEKGLLHVAEKLGHDSTSIVKRWQKEGQIPEGKKFQVLEMLKNENVI